MTPLARSDNVRTEAEPHARAAAAPDPQADLVVA